MQQQERFMVRTIKFVDNGYVYENVLAEGRFAAIKQAERLGAIDKDDHMFVRAFLEGHLPDQSKVVEFYTTVPGVTTGAVSIYKIDG